MPTFQEGVPMPDGPADDISRPYARRRAMPHTPLATPRSAPIRGPTSKRKVPRDCVSRRRRFLARTEDGQHGLGKGLGGLEMVGGVAGRRAG